MTGFNSRSEMYDWINRHPAQAQPWTNFILQLANNFRAW